MSYDQVLAPPKVCLGNWLFDAADLAPKSYSALSIVAKVVYIKLRDSLGSEPNEDFVIN